MHQHKEILEQAVKNAYHSVMRTVAHFDDEGSELVGARLSAEFSYRIEDRIGELEGCRKGDGDHDSDNYVFEEPLEVKVTQDPTQWSSNNKTDRPGWYLLVYLDKETKELFVALTWLESSAKKNKGEGVNFAFISNVHMLKEQAKNITAQKLFAKGNPKTIYLLGSDAKVVPSHWNDNPLHKSLGHNKIQYKTVDINTSMVV